MSVSGAKQQCTMTGKVNAPVEIPAYVNNRMYIGAYTLARGAMPRFHVGSIQVAQNLTVNITCQHIISGNAIIYLVEDLRYTVRKFAFFFF